MGDPASLPESCQCGVHYCSASCRQRDLSRHAILCPLLARLAASRPHLAALQTRRDDVSLLQALLECAASPPIRRLAPMPADPRPLPDELLELAAAILEEREEVDAEVLRELASVEQNNAFGLNVAVPGGAAIPLGRAVYLQASRFNHACNPNVARIPDGAEMVFVTRRAIDANEELFISYCRPGLIDKHDALRRDYGFDCLCKEEDEVLPSCNLCGAEMVFGKCVYHEKDTILDKATAT